jgi:hypothetical protein
MRGVAESQIDVPVSQRIHTLANREKAIGHAAVVPLPE